MRDRRRQVHHQLAVVRRDFAAILDDAPYSPAGPAVPAPWIQELLETAHQVERGWTRTPSNATDLGYMTLGTAFAVGDRLLATNAHITEFFNGLQGVEVVRVLGVQSGTGAVVTTRQSARSSPGESNSWTSRPPATRL